MKITGYMDALKAALSSTYSVLEGTIDEATEQGYPDTFVCVADSAAEFEPVESYRTNMTTYTVLVGLQFYAIEDAYTQARIMRDDIISTIAGTKYDGCDTIVNGWERMESTTNRARYQITITIQTYEE